jgi:hypothetical protein
MRDTQIQRWKRQHERGALRYVLLDGAVLYGSIFFAVAYFGLQFALRRKCSLLEAVGLAVTCILVGIACAWIEWRRNDRLYRDSSGPSY